MRCLRWLHRARAQKVGASLHCLRLEGDLLGCTLKMTIWHSKPGQRDLHLDPRSEAGPRVLGLLAVVLTSPAPARALTFQKHGGSGICQSGFRIGVTARMPRPWLQSRSPFLFSFPSTSPASSWHTVGDSREWGLSSHVELFF